jgi:hypothetical protein
LSNLTASYRGNAAAAQAEADAATLDNVRDRNLRAAYAWTQMADRQERTDRARATREGNTAAAMTTEQVQQIA